MTDFSIPMNTIYLLCGVLCDNEVWAAQADALRATHDVRVVSFQEFDSIRDMARHVLDGAPERFALAGHSMGGRVALEVYRQAQERVVKLALLDTGYEPVGEGEAERRGVLVRKAAEQGIGAIAETWGRPMIAPCNQDAVLPSVIAMVNRMSAQIHARQTRALLSCPDATDVLGTIGCPTLLLCGKQDAWSPPDRHERMARLIPSCRLELIDDCGHMSPMERPAEVAAALDAWLGASSF